MPISYCRLTTGHFLQRDGEKGKERDNQARLWQIMTETGRKAPWPVVSRNLSICFVLTEYSYT